MRTLVESLKRLYEAGRINKEKLLDMVIISPDNKERKAITQEEYNYITGQES